MKILILNGPNINMLGIREPNIYGNVTYSELCEMINKHCTSLKIECSIYQSNHEGDLIDKIQAAYKKYDGIVINAGGYTHTSVAILDALKSVSIPTIDVHISDINNRDSFRKQNLIKEASIKSIIGHGVNGYLEAIDYLSENYEK